MRQDERNEIYELHTSVQGIVQGVGFRYFVIQKALSLGLRGYTRNESDGSVEVVAQGTRPALEQFLTLLRRGPSAAMVSEVRTIWRKPTEHLSGFHLRW